MSLLYIRTCYNVPAKRGQRIRYTGAESGPAVGVIVGARQQYLRVRFDGMPQPLSLHPTWKVEYLP